MTTTPASYGYKNTAGAQISIAPAGPQGTAIGIGSHATVASLIIPNTQAPTIALAILKAAGVNPSGNPEPDTWQECVTTAAGYLDDSILVKDRQDAREELTRRKDELIGHLLGECSVTPYRHASEPLQMAIDMIIELQDEAAK